MVKYVVTGNYTAMFNKKAYNRAYHKAQSKVLRVAVLVLLGNRCVQCGFSDSRALQVDHIRGGGGKERAKLFSRGIYWRILRGARGYQLLCANCNWIKRSMRNELPYNKAS